MRSRGILGAGAVALFLATPLAANPRGLPALEGRWTIVRAGGEAGTLDLGREASVERRTAGRVLQGRVRTGGEELFLTYSSAPTRGVVGALGGERAPASAGAISVYSYDAVEGAFLGLHGGEAESLRRALPGNAVDVYVDGAEMLPRYLEAIASARETIHCECYKWHDDEVGRQVAAALAERARSGVRVRVTGDAVASRAAGPVLDGLRAAGCEVRCWNPVAAAAVGETVTRAWGVLTGGPRLDAMSSASGLDVRNHRKTLVVDGRVAFVGGMNLGHEYISVFHDVHARIRGPAVAPVQRHFVDTWRRAGGTLSDAGLYPPLEAAGPLSVDIATTLPGARDELKRIYLARVGAARREVLLETPFFGDEALTAAVHAAVKRGVRVVLILPDDEQNLVGLMGAYHGRIRAGLVLAGVEVRTYPKMTHAKVAVVDGEWATIGSCNLDNRSFERNLEENLCVEDARFAGEVRRRVFEADIAASRRCLASDPAAGLVKRATGWIGSMFHHLL